ncbi:MAG: ABC transporter permease [Bacteroidales bacterium]|nr:ABC transporter permease [Bacteroidales bacterium]
MKNLRFVLRIIQRHPLMFLTNFVGLTIALTMTILAITYVRFELSYDRHFPTKDRAVRLYHRVTDNTSAEVYGISLRDTYSQLPAQVPEIETAVQLYGGYPTTVKSRDQQLNRIPSFFADKEVFEVFGLSLIHGEKATALAGKGNAVVSESLALKLFGTTDCLGKTIEADQENVKITGIMANLPKNSHISMDVLISMNTLDLRWFGGLEFQTYYLLKPNVDRKTAEKKINAVSNELLANWASATNSTVQSGVEPLPDLYLFSRTGSYIPNHGSLSQLIIVGLITLFVLVTAIISYINLFIIQGEKRIVEISTRSMFGATKASISKLFFLETLIVFLVSTMGALLLSLYMLPNLSSLLQSKVEVGDLFSPWGLFPVAMVLVILLGISSLYPALYLSRMQYTLGLRGKISASGNNNRLSTTSVFIQFTVVAFFISCLITILAQLHYMRKVPPGFEPANVITISGCTPTLSGKYPSLRDELLQLPFVTAVSGGEHYMGGGCSGQLIRNIVDDGYNDKNINEYRVKPGFGELMQFELAAGRFFRESMADSQAVMLNEAAVRLLGIEAKAGQKVLYNDEPVEVIGIIRDFYYMSNPGDPIQPLALANCFWGTPNIYIRTRGDLTAGQLDQIKGIFSAFDPGYLFQYKTLSEVFEGMYRKENRLARLVLTGGVAEVVISLISLLALTILNISRRRKEIGIRKVNGSSARQVISLLLKETLVVVMIAIIIASAVSYLIMLHWLNEYAQRIHLHAGYFLATALFVIILALTATIGQTWYAATRNPVDALRYE